VLVLGAFAPAAAQHGASPPQPLDRTEPDAPTNAFGIPLEGYAKVRYTVLANGTTADVRVVDVMPPQLNTRDVVSAVEGWRFEPAKAGDEAIDWFNNESVIVFDAENVPLEASPRFAQAYVNVDSLITEEDFDKAKKQNETLIENQTMRLVEIGLAQTQATLVNLRMENLHDAYDAIVRATDPEAVTLPDPELATALRYRFGIEIELGRYASSLETFDRLAAIEALAEDDVVKSRADAVRQALQTADAVVAVKGRVAREPWTYTPTRRAFGFTDVDGSIRGLELECDRRKQELEFSDDVEWSIPESWGACKLFVDARRDTTFTLVEFPTAATAQ